MESSTSTKSYNQLLREHTALTAEVLRLRQLIEVLKQELHVARLKSHL